MRRTVGRPGRLGVWVPLEDSPQLPWAPVQLVSVSWAESLQKLCGYLGHHDLSSSSPSATTSPFLPQPGLALAFWSGASPPSSPTGAGQGQWRPEDVGVSGWASLWRSVLWREGLRMSAPVPDVWPVSGEVKLEHGLAPSHPSHPGPVSGHLGASLCPQRDGGPVKVRPSQA